MRPTLPDGVVVVSPHLDDAILSLGAAIAHTTRTGRRVTVLTVFGGDPGSTKPAGGWDRRAGFATEGAAARARRLEDDAACGMVGADPHWLSFSEADYRDSLDDEPVLSAVSEAVRGESAVLLPGFPLTNPDHAWLTDLLVRRGMQGPRMGLYAEQPYRFFRAHRRHLRPPVAAVSENEATEWTRLAGALSLLRTKRSAILEYRSQAALLGLQRGRPSRLDRLLAHEMLARGEAVAWLP